jgi:hypothetical protein
MLMSFSTIVCFIQSCSPSSCSDSFSYLTSFYNVYTILRPNFESMALGLSGEILVFLSPDMIFFLVSARSNVLSSHPANVILFGYV